MFQTLELVVGLLLCGVLAFVLLNGGSPVLASIFALPALLTIRRFVVFLSDRQAPRVIELAHGTLHLRHIPAPGQSQRIPARTVVAVRAQGTWSLIPPVRRTCLRIHFRTGASLKLIDEMDSPDVLLWAEVLNDALQQSPRPPNPDTRLESAVAALRRPDSGI